MASIIFHLARYQHFCKRGGGMQWKKQTELSEWILKGGLSQEVSCYSITLMWMSCLCHNRRSSRRGWQLLIISSPRLAIRVHTKSLRVPVGVISSSSRRICCNFLDPYPPSHPLSVEYAQAYTSPYRSFFNDSSLTTNTLQSAFAFVLTHNKYPNDSRGIILSSHL
jgi:hypothetical protein